MRTVLILQLVGHQIQPRLGAAVGSGGGSIRGWITGWIIKQGHGKGGAFPIWVRVRVRVRNRDSDRVRVRPRHTRVAFPSPRAGPKSGSFRVRAIQTCVHHDWFTGVGQQSPKRG